MANIGICGKDSKGNRKYKLVRKVDVYGNSFIVCDLCGSAPMQIENKDLAENNQPSSL